MENELLTSNGLLVWLTSVLGFLNPWLVIALWLKMKVIFLQELCCWVIIVRLPWVVSNRCSCRLYCSLAQKMCRSFVTAGVYYNTGLVPSSSIGVWSFPGSSSSHGLLRSAQFKATHWYFSKWTELEPSDRLALHLFNGFVCIWLPGFDSCRPNDFR